MKKPSTMAEKTTGFGWAFIIVMVLHLHMTYSGWR